MLSREMQLLEAGRVTVAAMFERTNCFYGQCCVSETETTPGECTPCVKSSSTEAGDGMRRYFESFFLSGILEANVKRTSLLVVEVCVVSCFQRCLSARKKGYYVKRLKNKKDGMQFLVVRSKNGSIGSVKMKKVETVRAAIFSFPLFFT